MAWRGQLVTEAALGVEAMSGSAGYGAHGVSLVPSRGAWWRCLVAVPGGGSGRCLAGRWLSGRLGRGTGDVLTRRLSGA